MKKASTASAKKGAKEPTASARIDARIRELGGWRGDTLAQVRALIKKAVPYVTEEWKWNVPVWSANGIICTGEAYAKAVKLTFARGASLPDPTGLFNSSLSGNTRRAIDIAEGEKLNARAFTALIKAAARPAEITTAAAKAAARAAENTTSAAKATTRPKQSAARSKSGVAPASEPVTLLSSGNPQIAKGDGDAPVQQYIAAMPGWKRAVGEELDALIGKHVPKGELRKAVKWNTPLYGVEGQGFFLGFYCFARYVQVTFFRGTSLDPVPPKASKVEGTRYFEIFEGDTLDKALLARWVKQACAIPGWVP